MAWLRRNIDRGTRAGIEPSLADPSDTIPPALTALASALSAAPALSGAEPAAYADPIDSPASIRRQRLVNAGDRILVLTRRRTLEPSSPEPARKRSQVVPSKPRFDAPTSGVVGFPRFSARATAAGSSESTVIVGADTMSTCISVPDTAPDLSLDPFFLGPAWLSSDFGASVAGAGDLNADGFADIVYVFLPFWATELGLSLAQVGIVHWHLGRYREAREQLARARPALGDERRGQVAIDENSFEGLGDL